MLCYMSKIRIGGCDPGFANLAFSALDLSSVGGSEILGTRLVVTKKSQSKCRVIQDELRRIHEIEDAFIEFLDEWKPHVWAMEEPGKCLMKRGGKWVSNPSLVRTSCLMWGSVVGICRARNICVVAYTSQAIKKAVCGANNASKADMAKEIKGRYGDYKGWTTNKKVEHEVDAVGAAITAFKEPFVMALLKQLESVA
jgi:Holliday junction resolvasome RuvABC endonuclease subunit